MTTVITSPLITTVRLALAATLNAEFVNERIVFDSTMLDPTQTVSQAAGAVFFENWVEDPANVAQIGMRFGVQIYDATNVGDFGAQDSYDPALVELWMERATVALKANQHAIGVWFLRVTENAISQDPSNNPSQGELRILAYTANPYDAPNI